MTTPTATPAQQAAEDFREEIRASLAQLHEEIAQIREGLTQAASQPAPIGTERIGIDNIIMTYDDKGKPAYKATGTPYNKFGVRIWDETLPLLGIDPANLKPGPNPINPPIAARVMMVQNDEGKQSPRKVIGKA